MRSHLSRRLVLSAFAGVVLFIAPRAAAAQCTVVGTVGATCAQNRAISATVRNTARLTVTPTVQPLGTPTDVEFNTGFSVRAASTIQVRANDTWQVTVRSNNATWTGTGGARLNKPRADLFWGPTAGGGWTVMNNTATVFATGSATAATNAVLFYRINWFFALDTPGTYTINVIFTVSTT